MKNSRRMRAVLLVLVGLWFSTAGLLGAASPFFTNGTLNVARAYHTATLLQNGKILVAGGYNGNSTNGSELYDPATGTSATNTPLITARHFHTATLLLNGKVMVAGGLQTITGGGQSTQTILTNAELYDPVSNTWTATGSLNAMRFSHTATLLANGKVLVAGGESPVATAINSAEIYDPATGNWTTISNMVLGRYGHTMTLLPDGTVLAAGGRYGIPQIGSITATAEIFDPAAGSWTSTGSMSTNRYEHAATLLNDGRVLVSGGASIGAAFSQLASAEIYDPVAKAWSATGSMSSPRQLQTSTLLPSGKILTVMGGAGSAGIFPVNSAEVYDPTAGTWSTNGVVNTGRMNHTATQLPGGQIVLIGGVASNGTYVASIETCEPTNGSWTVVNPMHFVRSEHTLTLLPNGTVLAVGGSGNISNCEFFDSSSGIWQTTGSMSVGRFGHTATLLTNGLVLATGGFSNSTYLADTELYDESSGFWTETQALHTARTFHTATLLLDGRVLVAGGQFTNLGASSHTSGAEIFSPSTALWTITGSMAKARQQHAATLLPNGKVLVTGGLGLNNVYLNNVETFDPGTGTWTTNNPMNYARIYHTATLLPNGKVLVAGGFNGSNDWTATAELFDPASNTWTLTGSMNFSREEHTATLLLDGRVLVTTGLSMSTGIKATEIYDPATGVWFATNSVAFGRYYGAAALLPNGKVLLAGGTVFGASGNDAEVFDPGLNYSNSWQPVVTSIPSPPALDLGIAISGSQFRGNSEGSGGNGTQDSAADYPLVQLRALESGETRFIPVTAWTSNSITTVAVTNFPHGWLLATVFVDGIPSQSSVVDLLRGSATVTLSNLIQTNDGTAKSVTVTTVPPNVPVTVTYNGSSSPPTNVGSYTVIAVVTDANLDGGATNTLQIVPAFTRNFGADVSHFQDASGIPETNWTQMYAQGARFVFAKGTEGLTGPDDTTTGINIANAQQAGLLAGVYHFAHPENRPTTNGAVQEADHLLSVWGSEIVPGNLRPVLDLETGAGVLTPSQMTDWVLAFSQEIINKRGAGAMPILYCLSSYASTNFDSRLASTSVWIDAGGINGPTNGNPSPLGVFTNWAFWQYGIGSVGGISPIDLDVCHDEFAPLSSYLIPSVATGAFNLGAVSFGGNGFSVSFTNTPGTHFTLLSATNATTPLVNWTVVGAAVEVSPGQFQAADPSATNSARKFYRVRSP